MIRAARPDDIPAILGLIRELAIYEREPVTTVTATEDALHQAFFGPSPSVFCHVGERDGEVLGAAIWFISFSTWLGRHGLQLEDLIVSERARGTGLGRDLFDELRRICVERGYPRLDWRVLDWNPAAGFYEGLGGRRMPEWINWRLAPLALAHADDPPHDVLS